MADGGDSPAEEQSQSQVFCLDKKWKQGNEIVCIAVAKNEVLYLHGLVEVCILYGTALLNGYASSRPAGREPEWHRIYAPIFCPAFAICSSNEELVNQDNGTGHDEGKYVKRRKLVQHPALSPDLEDFIRTIWTNHCNATILLARPLSRTSLHSSLRGAYDVSRLPNHYVEFPGLPSIRVLPNLQEDDATFVDAPEWQNLRSLLLSKLSVISELPLPQREAAMPVILTCGPKNAGKSTMSQYLLNSILSCHRSVAYLECDLGQTEFTPAGLVSLNVVTKPAFGPPESHIQRPFQAYFVGDTSPEHEPQHYVQCIQSLLQLRTEKLKNMPLIINSCGWTEGIGRRVLYDIFALSRANMVIEMTKEGSYRLELCKHVRPDFEVSQYFIPSVPLKSPRLLVGRSLRRQRMLTQYFSRLIAKPTLHKISLSKIGLSVLSANVYPSTRNAVFNGSCVGLIGQSIVEHEVQNANQQNNWRIQKSVSRSLRPCLGLGIVNAVNPDEDVLYLLTPENSNVLKNVVELAKGFIELPINVIQGQSLRRGPYASPTTLTGMGSKALVGRHVLRHGLREGSL